MEENSNAGYISRSASLAGGGQPSRWESASVLASARSTVSSKDPRPQAIPEVKFDIAKAKDLALAKIPKSHLVGASTFTRFYTTELMDQLIYHVKDYFESLFRYHKAVTESDPNATDHENLQSSKDHAYHALKELGTTYANILLLYSNHERPLVEKRFFEILYDFTQLLLMSIFDQKYWPAIKREVGRVFRSPQFSKLDVRKNEAPEPLVPLRMMYTTGVKASIRDDSLEHAAVHRAIKCRSPLISVLFPTAQDLADLNTSQPADPFVEPQPPSLHPMQDSVENSLLIHPEDLEEFSRGSHPTTHIVTKGKGGLPSILGTGQAGTGAQRGALESKVKSAAVRINALNSKLS